MVMSSVTSVWKFLVSLRVEPIVMLMMMTILSRNTVMQQLLQDKLCQFEYKRDAEFCHRISEEQDSAIKNSILADVSRYMSLKESISVVPQVLFVLFSGSWCDRFKNGRRNVILIAVAGVLMDTMLILLNALFYEWDYRIIIFTGIPSAILGNGLVMASCSFITASTEGGDRAVRFLVLEIFTLVGIIGGFLSGGSLLAVENIFSPKTGLRNYNDVLIVGLLSSLICMTWAFIRVRSDVYLPSSSVSDTTSDIVPQSGERPVKHWFALQDLRDIKETMFRPRAGNDRSNMWILIGIHASVMLPYVGATYVIFPFCQRVYKWNAPTYGLMMGLAAGVRPIAVAVYTSLIVKPLGLNELQIAMVGLLSFTLGLISMGSILSPTGFYFEAFGASLTGSAVSGIRSFLSLRIPSHEITKVYCIMQITEAVMPFIGSAFMSAVFAATIAHYPTLVLHCCALLLTGSLAVVAHMDLRRT